MFIAGEITVPFAFGESGSNMVGGVWDCVEESGTVRELHLVISIIGDEKDGVAEFEIGGSALSSRSFIVWCDSTGEIFTTSGFWLRTVAILKSLGVKLSANLIN